MKVVHSIAELPAGPAVYALYGGTDTHLHVAYVGIGGSLQQRINQHLVRRDSSIATGVSAVHLNPDRVVAVRWWEHPAFARIDDLEAAELVAFDVLEPALRSRANITTRARALYSNAQFAAQMRDLFSTEPSGQFVVPSLSVALHEIAELKQRVTQLERQYSELMAALTVRDLAVTREDES